MGATTTSTAPSLASSSTQTENRQTERESDRKRKSGVGCVCLKPECFLVFLTLLHHGHLCFVSISQDIQSLQPSLDAKLLKTRRKGPGWDTWEELDVRWRWAAFSALLATQEASRLQCLSSSVLLHCTEISTTIKKKKPAKVDDFTSVATVSCTLSGFN